MRVTSPDRTCRHRVMRRRPARTQHASGRAGARRHRVSTTCGAAQCCAVCAVRPGRVQCPAATAAIRYGDIQRTSRRCTTPGPRSSHTRSSRRRRSRVRRCTARRATSPAAKSLWAAHRRGKTAATRRCHRRSPLPDYTPIPAGCICFHHHTQTRRRRSCQRNRRQWSVPRRGWRR